MKGMCVHVYTMLVYIGLMADEMIDTWLIVSRVSLHVIQLADFKCIHYFRSVPLASNFAKLVSTRLGAQKGLHWILLMKFSQFRVS